MKTMGFQALVTFGLGVPLAVGYAALSNSVELSPAATLGLFVVVIGVPVLSGIHAGERRRERRTSRRRSG